MVNSGVVKVICVVCGKLHDVVPDMFGGTAHLKCASCGGKLREAIPVEQPKSVAPPAAEERKIDLGQAEASSLRDDTTLIEVRSYVQRRLREGTTCPCCGQNAKIYKRKLNAWMARALIAFFHASKSAARFHALTVLSDPKYSGLKTSGDYGKLVYWGLIEEAEDIPKAKDGNPNTGYYRMTALGRDFVMGATKVRRYICIYNNTLVESEDESEATTSITEALGNQFNYNELMGKA